MPGFYGCGHYSFYCTMKVLLTVLPGLLITTVYMPLLKPLVFNRMMPVWF